MNAVTSWVVTLLFLWASGTVVAAALRLRVADRLVALAIQIALGLSIWPVIFQLTRWTAGAMRVAVYATIVIGLVVTLVRRRGRGLEAAAPLLITFLFLSVLTVGLRMIHIRGQAFPPWVDGVHHGMIVRLLLERGVVPATADPYIAGAGFFYHWGFHVPAAFVAAATSPPDIPTFLLQYGQALNALTLLMVYAAGRVLLRSREGGLFAAVLAVFVSYYPAFYVSWGRYTHLTGTLVLPPLAIALWMLARARRPWRWMIVTALLAAGLVLIHVRIALFAMAFAVVLLVATRPFMLRTILRWGMAAVVAGLLAGPWLVSLARNPHVGDVVTPTPSGGLPIHIVGSLHNRELLAIASAGVSGMAGWLEMPLWGRIASGAWWLLIVFVSRFEPKTARAKRRLPWGALALLGGWALILGLTLHWRPLGLDLTALASLDSALITMFLPLSLAGAALITWVLARLAPNLRDSATFVVAAVLAVIGSFMVRDVINPQTVFTEPADLRALHWIERNVPANAVFAVDARPWMAPAWVGIDGGYWLHVTTGRKSILPPLLYGWSLPRTEVDRINTLLDRWSRENSFEALRAAGVTHVYLGARAKDAKRAAVLASPHARVIHRDGRAIVLALR